MRITLAVAAAFLTPVSALAGPYDGTYRPNAEWAKDWDCSIVGADGGALAIRNNTFFGLETECALTNPVSVRNMNATLYDAECSGEGETWTQRMLFALSPEGVSVVYGDGTVSELVRCP